MDLEKEIQKRTLSTYQAISFKEGGEYVINELREKMNGMREFAAEHYKEVAANGALTVINEIESWLQRKEICKMPKCGNNDIYIDGYCVGCYDALKLENKK